MAEGDRPASPPAPPALRRAATWLAARLVGVFMGVYAAAWAADREAAAARERRAAPLRRALVTELRDATRSTRRAAAGTAALLAFYDSARAAGGRPPLRPRGDAARWTPQMWNATVAARGLELRDVPTFYGLATFYDELDGGSELLARLTSLSDSYAVPLADDPAAVFYDGNSTRLKARYRWYPESVRRANRLAERVTARGDSLAALLERTAARP